MTIPEGAAGQIVTEETAAAATSETHEAELRTAQLLANVIVDRLVQTVTTPDKTAREKKKASLANVPRYVAPTFHKKLQSLMSKSGKLVRLHCQFDGQPCPSVTWYRNEAIINPSDRFKIKSEANTSTLEICNVGVNDSGIYTCRAVNEAGSASTTANIVVAGKQHPSSPDNPMPSALLAAGDKTSDIGMPFFIRLVWIL